MHKYPVKSYQRLYDSSLEPLWEVTSGLSSEEDGSHFTPEQEFFEWWYFDAALSNGQRLVIIFHSAVFNLTARPPAVDIRLTSPDSEPLISFKVYSHEQCKTSKSHCGVEIANCRVNSENQQKFVINIQQDNIVADLVYKSQLQGWKPGTGYLFYDDTSGHFFKWVVPAPLAKVSGTLQINHQEVQVDGIGYHDHNWGNIHLEDAFQHWHWGRFISSDQKSAFVFGDVVSKGEKPVHVKPVLLVVNGEIQPPQEITVEYKKTLLDKISSVEFSKEIWITGAGSDSEFNFFLTTGKTLEALTFASPVFRHRKHRFAAEILYYLTFNKPLIGKLFQKILGNTGYLRFQSEARLQMKKPIQMLKQGEAIYEIMSFH